MKTIPIALAAHYAGGTTSVGCLLKITLQQIGADGDVTDGLVYAFTSAGDDVVIDGVRYLATPGLDVTSVVTSSGLAVDNLELRAFNDGEVFTNQDVLSGIWRNAKFTISRYNRLSPADGAEVLMAGTVGNVQMGDDVVVAELLGLQSYLQQTVVALTSKTCRSRLGDSLCTKDLTAFTFAGIVTALAFTGDVASQQTFSASALVQGSEYFSGGVIEWLTGDNTGLTQVVKTFNSASVTLMLPTLLAIQAGDTFTIVAGCDKTLATCRDKFDNVLNFQGEPHLPGIDAMTKSPA